MIIYFIIEDLLKHYLQKKFHTSRYFEEQEILNSQQHS